MQKLLFFALIATLFLSSCNNDTPNQAKFVVDADNAPHRGEAKNEDDKLMTKIFAQIEAEKASGKTYKEVFPGYSFGMNAKQIDRTHKKMAKKGEVEKYKKAQKRSYAYAYLMPIMGGDIPTLFNFAFNDKGQMFKGEGVIRVPAGSSSLDILNVTADLFNEWFDSKPAFELPTYNYCARYIWITGNRLVDLRCEVEGVAVAFYNLSEAMPNLFDTSTPIVPNNEVEEDIEEETMQTQ